MTQDDGIENFHPSTQVKTLTQDFPRTQTNHRSDAPRIEPASTSERSESES